MARTPIKSGLSVAVESDISDLISDLEASAQLMVEFNRFAARRLEQVIRYQVFPHVAAHSALISGDFPSSYLAHIMETMKESLPISIIVADTVSVRINLDELGDKTDLSRGYHDEALILSRGKFQIHPETAHLPWMKGPYSVAGLMNKDKTVREDFWQQVIVERDVKGYAQRFDGHPGFKAAFISIMDRYPPSTYEQVASKRVDVWKTVTPGKAPEWLILEYGVDGNPAIAPADFSMDLQEACDCVALLVMEQAVEVVKGVLARSSAFVGSSGRFHATGAGGTPRGRFVGYKDVLESAPIDVNKCFMAGWG